MRLGGGAKTSGSSRSAYGLDVDPDARIQDITVGQQQRVEILKALYRGAEILDPRRADRRADAAGGATSCSRSSMALRAQGKSIIFITHKLHEVLEVADRITVLRRGKMVGTVPKEARDRGEPRAR